MVCELRNQNTSGEFASGAGNPRYRRGDSSAGRAIVIEPEEGKPCFVL